MTENPKKFMAALYGGLVTAGISAIPGLNFINCFCCAGILLGGFLAVFFYQQELDEGSTELTNNDCVQLGLWAGLIAAVAGTIVSVMVLLTFAVEVMMGMIHKMRIDFPPELQQAINEAMEQSVTPTSVILSFFITLAVDVLFTVLGALIGWAVFKKRTTSPM
jgi:ABC-type Fe3+ transport system permease subunit